MPEVIHLDILSPVFGKSGVENVINKLGPYLQCRGFHVRIVALQEGRGTVHEAIEYFSLSAQAIPLGDSVDCYIEFLREHGKPDIILAAAWPILVLMARMAIRKLNRGNCKIVAWPHQDIDTYAAMGVGGVECFPLSDSVFVLNKKTYDIVQAYHDTCNVVLVKNPVDFNLCPIRCGRGWKEKTLLFVGRFTAQKRLDIILQAVSRARDAWRLILIGEGKEGDDLPELIKVLHMEDRVILKGWQSQPWKSVRGISALVMASDFECLPLVALESLASGIPVISTPVNGIIDIIKPGVNGFLYPFEDIDGLAGILNAMSDGILPEISPEACRESVMDFEETRVLYDFREKLMEVLEANPK